ncbi:MAG: hypothetical protein WBH40_07790 [Ignavibacteriaceae bacterium]|jgi:hypothetical protein
MIDQDLLNRYRSINSCLMNMIGPIIHQKINESLIEELNNGEWEKSIIRTLNLVSYNHAPLPFRHSFLHSYLATAETGIIN